MSTEGTLQTKERTYVVDLLRERKRPVNQNEISRLVTELAGKGYHFAGSGPEIYIDHQDCASGTDDVEKDKRGENMGKELPEKERAYLRDVFDSDRKELGYATLRTLSTGVTKADIRTYGEPGNRYISRTDVARIPKVTTPRREKSLRKMPKRSSEREKPVPEPGRIYVTDAASALGMTDKLFRYHLKRKGEKTVGNHGQKTISLSFCDKLAEQRNIKPEYPSYVAGPEHTEAAESDEGEHVHAGGTTRMRPSIPTFHEYRFGVDENGELYLNPKMMDTLRTLLRGLETHGMKIEGLLLTEEERRAIEHKKE